MTNRHALVLVGGESQEMAASDTILGDISGNAATVTTINSLIDEGSNVTITGTGTAIDPYVINASGGGSSAFNDLTSGTNTAAAMVVGSGATLGATGSGTITATAVAVGGVTGLGTGVGTWLATPSSANLAAALTDETGSGVAVFATSPTLVTPVLGVATATSINKVAITAPATGSTLTIADGKTLTTSNTLTFTGTDSSSVAFGAGGTTAYVGTAQTWTAAQTFTNSDIKLLGSSTGANTFTALNASSTNYTTSVPAVTGVMASTSGSNLYIADITTTTAPLTKNADTSYANVTGLSQVVVPGTYKFHCYLPSTVASGSGGIKYCFNYTTTVLSSIQASGTCTTSGATGSQQTQTTTTQTTIVSFNAVVVTTIIEGTMVVTTGGTIDLQMAQATSNASNTVALVGGYMEFTRIA